MQTNPTTNHIDVLFIFLGIDKVSTSYRSFGTPPLGIAYLAAICERDGYNTKFVDLNFDNVSDEKIADIIRQSNPKVVGVSFVTEARFEAFKLFKLTKDVSPQIITLAGGPHPSLCAEDTLSNIEDLDIIVRGEGEETFSELMKSIVSKNHDLTGIRGLSYRENGKVRHNEDRLPIKDLNLLPFAALHLISFDQYDFHLDVPGHGKLKAAPIMSSRGCPLRCNFCATTKNWGAFWRARSPENVIAEIKLLIDRYRIEAIWFVDDNFNANIKRADTICNEIIKANLGIKWLCNMRVDRVKREHLELMAKAGCFSIEYGAESGSQRILDDVVKKKIKVEQIIHFDEWCQELGIMTDGQFIVSHPTETFEEAKETINLMKTLKGKSTLQIMKVYPGTEIERIAKEKNIIPQDFSWAKSKGKTDQISAITGEAPLFIDQINLKQITELMAVAWTEIGSFSTFYLVKKVLQKIRSPGEIYHYSKLGFPIILKKFRNAIFKQSRT